jgi:hypothetical protein
MTPDKTTRWYKYLAQYMPQGMEHSLLAEKQAETIVALGDLVETLNKKLEQEAQKNSALHLKPQKVKDKADAMVKNAAGNK